MEFDECPHRGLLAGRRLRVGVWVFLRTEWVLLPPFNSRITKTAAGVTLTGQ